MDFIKLDKDTIAADQFEQLIHMEETCGLEPFSPEMLEECIEDMDTYAFLDNDAICGFITVHFSSRILGNSLYIVNLNVAQEHRKRRIGERLMRTALVQYGRTGNALVTLDVAKTNTAALKLYTKLGFQITDFPSQNGETDYVMIAQLGDLIGFVRTPRLVLRPIALENTQQLADIFRNDTIKKTYIVSDLAKDAALSLAERIAALSGDNTRYIRGIYSDDTLIGLLNDVGIDDCSIELGWAIHPYYHNRGYATEAVQAAIGDLFRKGYTAVVAGAFSENLASIRVMEKCGMQLQEQTDDITYRGAVHKCIYYAIRRSL